MSEMVEITAFGHTLSIAAPRFQFLRSDSQWRLRHIYQPALASQTLAQTGVALDIGAGFGAFSLPFASAFPSWQVYCFEPDPQTFAALHQNIQMLGMTNIVPLPFAIGHSFADTPLKIEGIAQLLVQLQTGGAQTIADLADLLPIVDYSRSLVNPGYVERGANASSEYEVFTAPTLSAALLTVLGPNLLKLIAPKVEENIIADLNHAALDHVIGESWSHIPSILVNSDAKGLRQTWIPRAGQPLLKLRRSLDPSGRHPGLDVVVAMHNAAPNVLDCIDEILDGSQNEINVLVVDDGSTDGSSDLIEAQYTYDPRVTLLRNQHSGRSSAFNYGRMHSNAAHIAFVDATSSPGPGFFAGLLDLARHTGAEIVQGGFHILACINPERWSRLVSEEAGDQRLETAFRYDLGNATCHLFPSTLLMGGQTSIWRRVYRRDFLENKKIWFPEHIKSGDHFFQMLTLQNVADVPVLDGVSFGYRQNAEESSEQASEHDFYGLEMFRIFLKRGVRDGWNDFTPLLKSYVATVNRTVPRLNLALRIVYLKAAGELWAYSHKALGSDAFGSVPYSAFEPADFEHYARHHLEKLKMFDDSYGLAYLDSLDLHVPFLNLGRGK